MSSLFRFNNVREIRAMRCETPRRRCSARCRWRGSGAVRQTVAEAKLHQAITIINLPCGCDNPDAMGAVHGFLARLQRVQWRGRLPG